jgi:hypothetical protein
MNRNHLFLLPLFVAGCAGTAPELAGRYGSPCLPSPQADGSTQYNRLDFVLGEADWAVDFVVHADAACSTRLVTVHIDGPYELGSAREDLPGVHEGRFGFAHKTITPHVQPLADALSSMGCGAAPWGVDQTEDVLEGGCPAFGQYPLARCSADHDLVKLEGGRLQFGARPADNDMCTPEKRPAALNPVVFERR